MNWKIACLSVGLIVITSLTACSSKSEPINQAAPSSAPGDAMKSDTMKQGDAMKDDAMKKTP
jgi:hypothetical protein